MHKCIVCGNRSVKTNVNRKGVRYHGFPKYENMRREWFRVLGIDFCHKWQRICSDHFLEEDYRTGKKRFLLPNAIPQPYDRNGFSSDYATQNNDVETGNNVILPMDQYIIIKLAYYDENDYIESEFYREEYTDNDVVNNFISPSGSSRLTGNNEDMPDHTLGTVLRCSVENCSLNNAPDALPMSINDVPVLSTCDIEAAGQSSEKEKNNEIDNTDNTSMIIDLTIDLPMSINEVPVLSTCDIEAAGQSSEKEKNNEIDNTDNTSMIIDLTIDDSSNSSSSITLEPIEKRTSQCITIDASNTEDFTRDAHELIYEFSKEVILPSVYWKSQYLSAQNATGFYQRDSEDVTVKKVVFYNSLVPTIEVFGKKYESNTVIRTKRELENLLEKLDSIEKCYGRGGLVFEQCIGYIENSSANKCSGCQGLLKDGDLQRIKAKIEAKHKTIESLKNRMAEGIETVLALRRTMAENKENSQCTLDL